MKYLITSVILLLLSCKTSDKLENGNLILRTKFCKYPDSKNHSLKEVTLFKDEIEFKKIQFNLEREIKVSKIPYGNYKIRYKSIYNKYEYINIIISSNEQKLINICVDKIDYSNNNNILLLNEMKTGETLSFSLESQGCFHNLKKEIKVKKNHNNFSATFNDSTVELSHLQLKLFREFEIELRSNHIGWCSTNDKYYIYNENSREIYIINDESCQWRGFENLIKLLDLKK